MEPVITFTDKTVIKCHTNLYFGIRENVYYWSLKHKNIISAIETYIDCSVVKTEMKRYIPTSKLKIDYHLAERLLEDIMLAIDYLNRNNILQSDVKSDNIYYDEERELFLLADFDLAYYGRESFVNRTATPTTRPPELALIIDEENKSLICSTRYEEQARYRNKDKLITEKGDIFSLAVTVVTLLVGNWYSNIISEQIDRQLYDKTKYKALEKIGNFKYIDLLEKMLDFDVETRIGVNDALRFFSTKSDFPRSETPPREMTDTFNLYKIIKETIDDFRTSSPIIKREETAKLMTSYFSLRQKPPQDLYDFASTMHESLLLTGLLCTEEELYFYYFDDIISYFLITDDTYSHHESLMPIHQLNIPLDNMVPKDFIKKLMKNVDQMIDICLVLEFHLLF